MPAHQAYRILHFGFTVAPILAGLDKFFHPSPRLASISAPAHAQVVVPAGSGAPLHRTLGEVDRAPWKLNLSNIMVIRTQYNNRNTIRIFDFFKNRK